MGLGSNERRVTILIFWHGGHELPSWGKLGLQGESVPSPVDFFYDFQGCLDAKWCKICCFKQSLFNLKSGAPPGSND